MCVYILFCVHTEFSPLLYPKRHNNNKNGVREVRKEKKNRKIVAISEKQREKINSEQNSLYAEIKAKSNKQTKKKKKEKRRRKVQFSNRRNKKC